MNKNVGVFLSAEFLTGIRVEDRNPQELNSKIEEAARRVLVAGDPHVRVIVADCADEEQRLIAESFALQVGYRIRHVPALGPSISTTLGVEILAAAAADADLRIVAIGDEPLAQAATLEALSALKRWTVLVSIDSARRIDLADAVLGLSLDPQPLFNVVGDVLTEAPDPQNWAWIHAAAQQRFGPFSPRTYGFPSTESLVKAAQRHLRTHNRQASATTHTALVTRARPIELVAENADAGTRSAQLTDRKDVRRAALTLGELDEVSAKTLSDVAIGREVLRRLESNPFRTFTRTIGLDMHLFLECIRHLTSDKDWRPDGFTTPELMVQIASEHPGWSAGVPPNTKMTHLISLPDLPAEWKPYVRPVRVLDD